MRFLINASNIHGGGGRQVVDSICGLLGTYSEHHFLVVLSSACTKTTDVLKECSNVDVFQYDIKNKWLLLATGHDHFLDNLVKENDINAVLTVFGPCWGWKPRVPHLCGFARPQPVLTQSPHYQMYTIKDKLYLQLLKFLFWRSSKVFYTENPLITDLVQKMFTKATVYTVTNYYNQVFDMPEKWRKKILPEFDGCTLLTISTNNPHKNFAIVPNIALYLKRYFPNFKFRFVLTIAENALGEIPKEIKDNILFLGWVDNSECPFLYEQCDVMFMPSLMECFSASYPEAMRMKKPIITTDLEFARGLCGDAACYYDPIVPESAAKAIVRVATDSSYFEKLVKTGITQLEKFDTYEQRAFKLVKILENLGNKKN